MVFDICNISIGFISGGRLDTVDCRKERKFEINFFKRPNNIDFSKKSYSNDTSNLGHPVVSVFVEIPFNQLRVYLPSVSLLPPNDSKLIRVF